MTAKMQIIEKAVILMTTLRLPGVFGYDPEASITGLYTGPYFDPLAPRNLTAHLGDTATLPCTVRQLGDKSVSWVRMRDADILTVDRYTFVGDERFESHYSTSQETWNLVIKYVQERDAGLYECQVSTEPKMSQLFSLRVVIPKVTISPPGDRFVKSGSQVQVDCQISDVVQLPDYIFWYREGKRVLDQTDPNMLVTVNQTGAESITSTFIIHKVKREDSGNYTCMPSNLHAASVTLHVLNEHPAGLQGERNTSTSSNLRTNIFTTLCALLVLIAWSPGIEAFYFNDREPQVSEQDDSERLEVIHSVSTSSHETILKGISISEDSMESHRQVPEVRRALAVTSRR
ncbi:protein amalgam-like isoform X2 [Macrobrachium rosenbergii]|uniref:protein amalgam-like isoform X2 n=1 Tax=Macrobrachium rosenbergii TaxID=79674 RepID=UPI0034D69BFD